MRVPARIEVFGPVTIKGRGGRPRQIAAGWQAWNPDPRMERRMARLPGSGSFYWPTARDAYRRAQLIARDPNVSACRVEYITGRRIAYVTRSGTYARARNVEVCG